MNTNKILILQFRNDQSEDHEREIFHEEFNGYQLDLEFHNLAQENLSLDQLNHSDGLILGGSGEYYLAQGDLDSDWMDATNQALDKALQDSLPTLGICLGAQIIALHQGSGITDDEQYHESGSYQISLSDYSENCEIFSNLDQTFHAPLCHEDTPIDLPDHLLPLASSEKVPCQAYKLKDKPAWGVLFHPELNKERLRYRFQLYPNYVENDEDVLESKLESFNEDERSTEVLHRFYDFVAS